jgi:hypothetical protein
MLAFSVLLPIVIVAGDLSETLHIWFDDCNLIIFHIPTSFCLFCFIALVALDFIPRGDAEFVCSLQSLDGCQNYINPLLLRPILTNAIICRLPHLVTGLTITGVPTGSVGWRAMRFGPVTPHYHFSHPNVSNFY